jgi:hypothetical protein
VSGRWVHGDDFDSAEIEVERMPDNRVRVQGFALHGIDRVSSAQRQPSAAARVSATPMFLI